MNQNNAFFDFFETLDDDVITDEEVGGHDDDRIPDELLMKYTEGIEVHEPTVPVILQPSEESKDSKTQIVLDLQKEPEDEKSETETNLDQTKKDQLKTEANGNNKSKIKVKITCN